MVAIFIRGVSANSGNWKEALIRKKNLELIRMINFNLLFAKEKGQPLHL